MPNNAKKSVYREKEFGIYVLWKSLPAHFKGMKKKELEALGYTDPVIAKIIKIKSQTEFARHFNIKDLGTLTDWNKKIKNNPTVSPPATTAFDQQRADLNKKIILPNIDELRKNAVEQRKLLSRLKRENTILRRKIKLSSSSIKRAAIKRLRAVEPVRKSEPVRIHTIPETPRPKQSLFQRIRKVFSGD